MPRRVSWAVLAGVILLGGPDQAAAQADSTRAGEFTSPGGRYRVRITQVAHRRFTAEQSMRSLDNVDHIEYALAFLHAEDGDIRAETPYSDVYGFEPSAGPADLASLVSQLGWSPEEHFVILPVEGWASAPGTPHRAVLALTDTLGWSGATLAMDTLIWANSLVVVGDRHSDCHYSVEAFDGTTGRVRPLDRPPESPVGYELLAAEGRTVLVRSVLDNCARDVDRAGFEPECRAVDLDTFEARTVPCAGRDDPVAVAAPADGPFSAWLPLFDQEIVDWLANEYRAEALCAHEGAEQESCRQRLMEPLVRVWTVHSRPSADAPIAGEIIVSAEPGKTLAAQVRTAAEALPWTPDLYDPDWGYGPYLHHTVLERRGVWFLLPQDPFPEPVWISPSLDGQPPELLNVQAGDIIELEGQGWLVVGASPDGLRIREEQAADMWCREGDPPPPEPAPVRTLSRRELSDTRGHLRIRLKYLRGC